jgi:hypothetical protein
MLPTGSLVVKDPAASAWPKGIDWTAQLALWDPTETIASSSWTVTGPDALLTSSGASIVVGNKKTQLKLAAGTRGSLYTVTNSIITTVLGVHDDRSFLVLVEDQ